MHRVLLNAPNDIAYEGQNIEEDQLADLWVTGFFYSCLTQKGLDYMLYIMFIDPPFKSESS